MREQMRTTDRAMTNIESHPEGFNALRRMGISTVMYPGDNPITGALYPSAIRYGYGEIWSRPGLEHRQRALVAVAAFTALRLPEQVAKFGQSALNIGLTQTQVIEAIIQTAPLTGFPPALNALGAISAAFSA